MLRCHFLSLVVKRLTSGVQKGQQKHEPRRPDVLDSTAPRSDVSDHVVLSQTLPAHHVTKSHEFPLLLPRRTHVAGTDKHVRLETSSWHVATLASNEAATRAKTAALLAELAERPVIALGGRVRRQNHEPGRGSCIFAGSESSTSKGRTEEERSNGRSTSSCWIPVESSKQIVR